MARSVNSVETSPEVGDSVCTKIVQRVASVTEQEITQLPPLYDRIDPDALDDVVSSIETGQSPLSIRFTYAGEEVTIDGAGTVSIASSNR